MTSNPLKSNGDQQLTLKINLPKTGLFHFGFLWGLTPTGLVLLLHISMMWDDFLDLSMAFYILDLFSVILPIQLFYFVFHFYLRPHLHFANGITGSLFCNLLTLAFAHPVILLANVEMYEKSGIDWWKNWFIQFHELFEFLPAWLIVSVLLTLLEVVLKMNSSNSAELSSVIPAGNLLLAEEQTGLKPVSNESRIVLIESIQQYKTIYRNTANGISEEIARKTFEELTVDAGKTLLLVHKSFMVAPDLIERIQRDGRDYSLVLKHIKKPIPISRNKLEDVRALLL